MSDIVAVLNNTAAKRVAMQALFHCSRDVKCDGYSLYGLDTEATASSRDPSFGKMRDAVSEATAANWGQNCVAVVDRNVVYPDDPAAFHPCVARSLHQTITVFSAGQVHGASPCLSRILCTAVAQDTTRHETPSEESLMTKVSDATKHLYGALVCLAHFSALPDVLFAVAYGSKLNLGFGASGQMYVCTHFAALDRVTDYVMPLENTAIALRFGRGFRIYEQNFIQSAGFIPRSLQETAYTMFDLGYLTEGVLCHHMHRDRKSLGGTLFRGSPGYTRLAVHCDASEIDVAHSCGAVLKDLFGDKWAASERGEHLPDADSSTLKVLLSFNGMLDLSPREDKRNVAGITTEPQSRTAAASEYTCFVLARKMDPYLAFPLLYAALIVVALYQQRPMFQVVPMLSTAQHVLKDLATIPVLVSCATVYMRPGMGRLAAKLAEAGITRVLVACEGDAYYAVRYASKHALFTVGVSVTALHFSEAAQIARQDSPLATDKTCVLQLTDTSHDTNDILVTMYRRAIASCEACLHAIARRSTAAPDPLTAPAVTAIEWPVTTKVSLPVVAAMTVYSLVDELSRITAGPE